MRLLRDVLLTAAIFLFVGLIAVRLQDGSAEHISGVARAIDGDTLAFGDRRVRLSGLDAPELRQTCLRDGRSWPCGRDARSALSAMIDGAAVSCLGMGNDRYGRMLAVCRVGQRNINAALVDAGLAVADGDYVTEEARARGEARGLWAGRFERPRDWRRMHGDMAGNGNWFAGIKAWMASWLESAE